MEVCQLKNQPQGWEQADIQSSSHLSMLRTLSKMLTNLSTHKSSVTNLPQPKNKTYKRFGSIDTEEKNTNQVIPTSISKSKINNSQLDESIVQMRPSSPTQQEKYRLTERIKLASNKNSARDSRTRPQCIAILQIRNNITKQSSKHKKDAVSKLSVNLPELGTSIFESKYASKNRWHKKLGGQYVRQKTLSFAKKILKPKSKLKVVKIEEQPFNPKEFSDVKLFRY